MGGCGSDEPIVYSGEEQCVVQTGVGDLVAVGVWDALDEAVQTKPAQVICCAAGQVSGSAPRSPARWMRRSRLVNPPGCSRKVSRVASRAWERGSPKRSAAAC